MLLDCLEDPILVIIIYEVILLARSHLHIYEVIGTKCRLHDEGQLRSLKNLMLMSPSK